MRSKLDIIGYVNAGGKGTRLRDVLGDTPKSLARLGNPPITFIEHQVNWLLSQGITDVIVNAGADKAVARFVTDHYPKAAYPGVLAVCFADERGTGGDMLQAFDYLPDVFSGSRRIVICNSDTVVDVDIKDMLECFERKQAEFMISLTENDGVQYQDSYFMDANDRVLFCKESSHHPKPLSVVGPDLSYRATSTGVIIVSVDFVKGIAMPQRGELLSMYDEFPSAAIGRNSAYAYNNGTKFYAELGSIGSWTHYTINHPDTLQPFLCYTPGSTI